MKIYFAGWKNTFFSDLPRPKGYDANGGAAITKENVKKLTTAAKNCFDALLNKDLDKFSKYFLDSFIARTTIFPNTTNDEIRKVIDKCEDKALGWKLSGAGGGGYLVLVSDKPVENAIHIKIRRKDGY
jgi:galactokinase/mevalonate kinase-like predicted kinase